MDSNAALICRSYAPDILASPFPASSNAGHAEKDQYQKLHDNGLLGTLLHDRTTGRNIFWATDTYASLGKGFGKKDPMTPGLIAGRHDELASIRKKSRMERTRKHGEVCTPLSVCRTMCDHAYKALRGKDWHRYVASTVLEITCGVAPFLTSRHDLGNGTYVPVNERVGILDRKLQVIGEKARDKDEWLEWAFKAYESTYGYEFQGDNLLQARMNLFFTFGEAMDSRWGEEPSESENRRLLEIITWNLWQMDGLTGTLPYGTLKRDEQCSFFETCKGADRTPACLVKDWKTGKITSWPTSRSGK